MYIFDVETLGIESTSVILSMACIYFNPEDKPTYQQLVDSAFFVKLNAADQVDRLKRSVSKSTLEWWETQHASVKKLSLIPNKLLDVSPEFAHAQLRTWATQFPDYATSTVWARGNLDQMVLGSLEEKMKVDPVFHFARWRDVRTAVDLLSGSNNGYCKIPDFDFSQVIKHNPIHDCASDAMMLMYGTSK